MKGYTKIELFDGLTGKLKERVEDHNMMTGAVGKIARAALAHPYRGSRTYQYPFNQHLNLLSGLCLFDSEITENANNIWLPAGVKPVAYAAVGRANNSDNARMMGTYDNTESDTSQALTKKWVWTWTQPQGNGQIKCACLTHFSAGFFGFGGNQGTENLAGFGYVGKLIGLGTICDRPKDIAKVQGVATGQYPRYRYVGTVGSNYLDMCIDSDNNYKYMYRVSANGLSVIKHKMDFEKFDVFRSVINWQSYTEETYSGTFTGGGNFRGFYNSDEKKLYFWLDDGRDYYENGYSCTIYVYDIVNKTVGTHCTFVASSPAYIGSGLVVTNSAVYFATTYQNVKIYKYSFQSGSTTLCSGQIDTTESSRNQWPLPVNYIQNGIITFPTQKVGIGNGYLDVLVDTSDDSARYTVCSFASLYAFVASGTYDRGYVPVIPPYDNTQVEFGLGVTDIGYAESYPHIQGYNLKLEDSLVNSSNTLLSDTFVPCNYLGTINNLPDTVVKDATKTMKLTYIISAEDEEE